jgi:hypothetical protein
MIREFKEGDRVIITDFKGWAFRTISSAPVGERGTVLRAFNTRPGHSPHCIIYCDTWRGGTQSRSTLVAGYNVPGVFTSEQIIRCCIVCVRTLRYIGWRVNPATIGKS